MKLPILSISTLLTVLTTTTAFSPTPNPHSPAHPLAPHVRRPTSSSTALSMALTLYGSPGSRSPLVNWAANELGLALTPGDLSKNPHPFGQIPCLTDEGDGDEKIMVFESGAILNYLQSAADEGKGPKGDAKRAAVASWVAWANASLDPICFLETPEGKVYDTGLRNPNRRIDTLNTLLSKSPYLVQGQFSLADVAVASYLLYVIQFFPDVELYQRWPHVVRYMRKCAGREGYGQAFGGRVQGYCLERLEKMMESGNGGEEKKKMFGLF